MARFKPPQVTYVLSFEGTRYEGLEVKVRSTTTGELLKFIDLASKTSDNDPAQMGELIDSFARVLVSWNVDGPDDRPLPATAEGLRSLDLGMVVAITKAWVSAVASVSDELGKDSGSGETSPVLSLPMEPLSSSQAS